MQCAERHRGEIKLQVIISYLKIREKFSEAPNNASKTKKMMSLVYVILGWY